MGLVDDTRNDDHRDVSGRYRIDKRTRGSLRLLNDANVTIWGEVRLDGSLPFEEVIFSPHWHVAVAREESLDMSGPKGVTVVLQNGAGEAEWHITCRRLAHE